jgi:hypothetical protein
MGHNKLKNRYPSIKHEKNLIIKKEEYELYPCDQLYNLAFAERSLNLFAVQLGDRFGN